VCVWVCVCVCVCVFILFLVRELSECNCCLLARLCVLVKTSTTILDHTITLYFQKGHMQNSLTQPRPLTSDSIIQFSPSTFSPSRRGAGEWIADCSLKPFTFAYGPWTTRKYQICSIYCLQNSLNGHSENVPSRAAGTHWRCVRAFSVNRNDDEQHDD